MIDTTPCFFSVNNNDGTYHIECLFVVYRERFGHHPSFLPQDEERGKREGFSTKFWFLIKDDLTSAEAETELEILNRIWSHKIHAIENDDTLWDKFPFKNNTIVYSK